MPDLSATLPDAAAWWTPADRAVDPNGPGNHPFQAPSPSWFDEPAFNVFSRIVARQPSAPALCAGVRCLTYAETHRRVVALAGQIAEVTLPGEGVALLLLDLVDLVIAQMACFAAGRVCILVEATLPAGRQGAILAQAAPRLLIMSEDLPAPRMPDTLAIWRGVEGAEDRAAIPLPIPDLNAPAVVIYTSGSTGEPKGIVRTHRQVTARNLRFVEELRIGNRDRLLTLFSLTNSSGFAGGMAALLGGAELHLSSGSNKGLRGVLDVLQDNSITILWAVPSMLRSLLALPGAPIAVASVRATFSVGEPILRSDLDTWRRVVAPGCAMMGAYGLTEAGGVATWFLPQTPAMAEARVPIGYPCGLYDFAIVAESGQAVEAGEVGELWIRSAAITLGQWLDGSCQPMTAVADPTHPGRRILRTRDLVRLRPDGSLAYIGRADDMVKIRGNRVEPVEIEDALRRLPEIADVAVLAHQTATETVLHAFVVVAMGAITDRATLIRHLRTLLPNYMIPARLEFLPVIPRLPIGKVDTQRLRGKTQSQE